MKTQACPDCGAEMRYHGMKFLHMDTGPIDDLEKMSLFGKLDAIDLVLRVYVCPSCGRTVFYDDEVVMKNLR